jgi:hypothetical protein
MPTIKDPNKFKIKNSKDDNNTLSDHPELDFVRKIQFCSEGSELIQKRFSIYHRNAISSHWFSKT